MKKVIIITGPTAVGKTKLALAIAERFKTELINADIYQMYKGLDILTAKPTSNELLKIKHHLVNYLEPSYKYSIYNYQKEVRTLINQFDLPILVGGSGLYIDSVIYNYQFVDGNYKLEADKLSNEELIGMLYKLDEDSARKIPLQNRRRIIRQIELINMQDKEERSKKDELVYDALIIALSLPRDVLYKQINNRVLKMIYDGLIDEIKNNPNLSDTQLGKAIGYSDGLAYLNNEISLDQMIDNIQKKSRHYAKRQLTWYRNHQNIHYLNVNLDDFNETINEATKLIENFLKQ